MKHGQNTEKRKSLYNLLSVLNQCFHPGDTAKSRHGDTEKGRHGEEPKSDLRVSVSPRLRVGLPGLRVCFACSLKLSHFSHFMPLLEKRKIVALWPRTGYAEYPMSWTDLKDSPINSAELLRIPPQSGEPWQLHFPIRLWRSNDRART